MVSRFAGPARSFARVADAVLTTRGGSCTPFLGEAPIRKVLYDLNYWRDAESKPDAVIVGMSGPEELATDELAAGWAAVAYGIPLCIFSDVLEAWKGRVWFEPLRKRADTLFVTNTDEVAEAQERYPNCSVIASGNPAFDDYFEPPFSRVEVRSRLGVDEENLLVFISGTKIPHYNTELFAAVAEATLRLDRPCRVIISFHPSDKTPPEQYAETIRRWPHVSAVPREAMLADDIVAGCDLVIGLIPTLGVNAACQRIPVINYLNPETVPIVERNSGGTVWPAVKYGIEAQVFESADELANAIRLLTDPSSHAAQQMRKRQEFVYPRRPRGTAARIMVETMLQLVKK